MLILLGTVRWAPAVDDGDPLYVKSSVGDDGDLPFGRQERTTIFSTATSLTPIEHSAERAYCFKFFVLVMFPYILLCVFCLLSVWA